MNIKLIISKKIQKSILKIGIPIKYINSIYLTKNAKIGHYQINGIIKISKKININALKLSQKIIDSLEQEHFYQKMNISFPGFINIFLNTTWLSKKLKNLINCPKFEISKKNRKNIIIDYSSPNMAKEMHVGHLRSTILGDVMARTLEFLKHNVIRTNHIGDWGSQFGMIIAYFNKQYKTYKNINPSLQKLEKIYQQSKKLYKIDKSFKNFSKKCLVDLQNNEKNCILIWKNIICKTIKQNKKIYNLLNITLKDKHTLGESFYINLIPNMIEELKNKNIAKTTNGKIIVYLDEIKNKKGKPMGVTIQKKDTRFLYSTIDLACLKYRIQNLKADRIIYYTDIRQQQHLKQIQIIAEKAGYVPKKCMIEHHVFGMVLSKNKRPFKTRDGQLIKLNTLIEKSIKKAKIIIKEKNPHFKNKKISQLSQIIGISAIKYADLSRKRETNYIFDWNNMLSFNGNTAPYIQYTYTRIYSIIKKSKLKPQNIKGEITIKNDLEIKLSIKLLQFEEIISEISEKGNPHILCSYLFKLSSIFCKFYEKHSIIFSKTIKTRNSRLKLSLLTSRIIKKGLNILGIPTLKYM